MIPVIKKQENKHLIVFVHGLIGSAKTWQGDSERFVENLKKEQLIQDYFDIEIFEYPTTLFQNARWARLRRLIGGFLRNRPKEQTRKFNVGINAISKVLAAEIQQRTDRYETISFIVHSMGGLVAKSALTWMDTQTREKIYLLVSLSVPHIGAFLAEVGSKLVGDNPQIFDLRAMGEFTTQLNHRYSDLNPQPRVIYQGGNQDDVVPEISAIPPGVPFDQRILTFDDHSSVVLIGDRFNNDLYSKTQNELKKAIQPFVAVHLEIPSDVPLSFRAFLELTKDALNIDSWKFQGWENGELDVILKPGCISGDTLEDFLQKLAKFAVYQIPMFMLFHERGTLNFTIIKC